MAQYRQGKFDQQVALNNAKLVDYQRRDELVRAGAEADRVVREGRQAAAEARTVIASGGVEGPAVQSAVSASLVNSALDAAKIKEQAALKAWGLAQEGEDLKARARESKRAGILGAFGSVASGGSQALSIYSRSKG